MTKKNIDDLATITPPLDSTNLWVNDQTLPVNQKDRKLSFANLRAWIISQLGTSATKNMASGISTFGTASGSNVTTSATDTTAGRILKVGDFGLGALLSLDASDNLNNIHASGFYYNLTGGNTSGNNYPINTAGSLLVNSRSSNNATQTFIEYSLTPRYFFRSIGPGAIWSPWQELHHTGNYPSDTAWTSTTTLLNGWTGTVRYIRRAGMVTVVIDGISLTTASNDIVLNLPISYRPSVTVRFPLHDSNTSNLRGLIGTVGDLTIVRSGSSSLIGAVINYPTIT